jgi:hypothetical protein
MRPTAVTVSATAEPPSVGVRAGDTRAPQPYPGGSTWPIDPIDAFGSFPARSSSMSVSRSASLSWSLAKDGGERSAAAPPSAACWELARPLPGSNSPGVSFALPLGQVRHTIV